MDRANSPLRYPGGKSLIYPFVASFLEENNLIDSVYAEPFAGGAAVMFYLEPQNAVCFETKSTVLYQLLG